jgi:hypothetical protein
VRFEIVEQEMSRALWSALNRPRSETCVEVMFGFPDLLYSNSDFLRYIASSNGSMFSVTPDKQIFGSTSPFVSIFAHTSRHFAPFFLDSQKFRKTEGRKFVFSEIKYCQWNFTKNIN